MKYIVLTLISILLIAGCGSNTTINKIEHAPEEVNLEAIILGIHEGRQKLLLTTDVQKSNLNELTQHSIEDILRINDASLIWLDISKIPEEQLQRDELKIGSKIRYSSENEQLDTMPPTRIAKKIELIS